jgi:IS5 family transposase
LAAQAGRYEPAKQYKRMKRTIKTLRTRVGRVKREVQRKLYQLPVNKKPQAQDLLGRVSRILTQKNKDKNKL